MVIKRAIISVLLIISISASAWSQKVKTVECEYTYHAPENFTLEQAKRTAIERAQIQAIANEFGTTVSQTNITNISSSSSEFHSIGLSEVKGEWLEDLMQPSIVVDMIDGMFIITVKVKGKARELISAEADCIARILKNGKEDRNESESFFDGDQFYISFQSPSKGFIAVYLSDGNGVVSCLLPYTNQQDVNFPVKANYRYVLFDPDDGNEFTEQYYFTCGAVPEYNQIYIVFSPNKFTKALDYQSSNKNEDLVLPRELTENDFQKWLAKCRRRDHEMQIIRKHISITKQQ